MTAHRSSIPRSSHDGFVLFVFASTMLLWPQPDFAAEIWPVGGVRVSPLGVSSQLGRTVSDDAGGVLVAYSHHVGVASVMVTRVNVNGDIAWGPVEICPSANQPSDHVITADGNGGAIVAWEDRRAGDDPMVYAQRINGNGAIQWPANGVPVCSLSGRNVEPAITADDAGGAIIAWRRPGSNGSNLNAQRLLADGTAAPGWNSTTGVAVCAVDDEGATDHTITPDGGGGAVFAWTDTRAFTTTSIYGNRVGGDGAVLWASSGFPLASDEDSDYRESSIVSDGSDGAIVAFLERDRSDEEYRIHAQRINGAGQRQWDSVLCTTAVPDTLIRTWSASDSAGGAVVAWRRSLDGDSDAFARRVDAGGTPMWPDCGVQASFSGTLTNVELSIAGDRSGGAIMTWWDRSDAFHVLAQHLDGAGNPLWQTGGLDLDPEADHPHDPVVTSDGLGGGLFAWEGDCSVWCVYAQRINSIGIFRDGFRSGDTSAWSNTSP